MALEKATLIFSEKKDKNRDIEFMFNPTELKFSRSMNIEQSEGSRSNLGANKTSFKHPNPYQLIISNIILDTYENSKKDRNVLKPLKKFTDAITYVKEGETEKPGEKSSEGKRPPIYIFTWGTNAYLRCFIKSCNFRITMFLADGTPVRAIVDLTLEQADETTPKPTQETPNVHKKQREQQGRKDLKEKEPTPPAPTLFN